MYTCIYIIFGGKKLTFRSDAILSSILFNFFYFRNVKISITKFQNMFMSYGIFLFIHVYMVAIENIDDDIINQLHFLFCKK